MEKQMTYIIAAGLALLLSIFSVIRISSQRSDFDQTVSKALNTSAGYDKSFLGIVNRLETELANRASFGYQGGKDPMTGSMRRVAPAPQPGRGGVPSSAAMAEAPAAPTAHQDPVKLTAIIFDDKNKRYTAIIMDGERSYSLEVGDRIRDRVIRKITDDILFMEGDSMFYKYDIYGKRTTKRK